VDILVEVVQVVLMETILHLEVLVVEELVEQGQQKLLAMVELQIVEVVLVEKAEELALFQELLQDLVGPVSSSFVILYKHK
jgi:hypothetical protein